MPNRSAQRRVNDGHVHLLRRKRDDGLARVRIVDHLHVGPHLQQVRADPALPRHEADTGQRGAQAKRDAGFGFFNQLQLARSRVRGEHRREAERFQAAVTGAQRLHPPCPDEQIAFVG